MDEIYIRAMKYLFGEIENQVGECWTHALEQIQVPCK